MRYISFFSKKNCQVPALVALVAVCGIFYLYTVHASTGTISLEAENGMESGPALVATDNSASGGKAVQFGTTSSKPLQLSQPFYDDPYNQVMNAYNAETDPALKHQLWQIAGTPYAVWWGVDTSQSHFTTAVTNVINMANAKKQTPVFALYAVPDRDCNGAYSKGGFPDVASYEQWVDWFLSALGHNPAIVIVEPDGIGMCGTAQERADRTAVLKYDMDHIQASDPNAYAYIHAGSGQLGLSDVTNVLLSVDVGKGRGIAMNVASFGTTDFESSAADQIIASLAKAGVPNMHYVIDTGRNGNGSGGYSSCNPPGRAVGTRPTTHTSDPLDDAYLWIKYPGGSDGVCHAGDPPAGTFMPALAGGMAQTALSGGIISDLPNGTFYAGY